MNFGNHYRILAVNPENGGARAVVVQRGIAVCRFIQLHAQIINRNPSEFRKRNWYFDRRSELHLQANCELNEQIQRS